MDYHEAKYRTLWKLAFYYSGVWGSMKESCDFCEVTETSFSLIIKKYGIEEVDCDKCPPIIICEEFLNMQGGQKINRISSEQWKYLFDKLFELPMPEII